ncbi:MAG: hypothetical protein JXA18_07080 [Chitinispirillaceae bacterium]|nr:hypothetical protein [Chitinispirillaceae bacterium]
MSRFSIKAAVTVSGFLLCAGLCFGEVTWTGGVKLRPSGFASMFVGDIVRGGVNKKTQEPMNNVWIKQIIAGLSVDAALSDRNFLDIGLEMQIYNDFPISLVLQPQYRYLYFYPYLSSAQFTHLFGNVEKPLVTLHAGYFPFKYNRDVRNLGEYLFRTGTYPQYLLNSVDFPLARVMGIHAAFSGKSLIHGEEASLSIAEQILTNLSVDALLYFNLQWYAVGDGNLAIMLSDRMAGFFEFGLGITFNSIISSDDKLTTPHDPATLYHIAYNETTGESDSSFYTFKGAKLMGRWAFDFKKLLPCSRFGSEDLRLYAEAAILGLRDYPRNLNGGISYDHLLERVPVTLGFAIPAFGFLDVLNIEVEYFKCPYPNDIGAITQKGLPIPGQITETGTTRYRELKTFQEDRWKWSLHAVKKIGGSYTAMAQIASDHLRPLAVNDQNIDFEEALHTPGQWYFMLKFTAGF